MKGGVPYMRDAPVGLRADDAYRGAPQHEFPVFVSVLTAPTPPLIVFDLDHTLIHSVETTRATPSLTSFAINVHGQAYRTHVRPHAFSFVDALNHRGIKYAVWTAGMRTYAHAILRRFDEHLFARRGSHFRPEFVWAREDWSADAVALQKDVRRVVRDTGFTNPVLLDDSPLHLALRHNRNYVQPVPEWRVDGGGGGDDDLFARLKAIVCGLSFSRCRAPEIKSSARHKGPRQHPPPQWTRSASRRSRKSPSHWV